MASPCSKHVRALPPPSPDTIGPSFAPIEKNVTDGERNRQIGVITHTHTQEKTQTHTDTPGGVCGGLDRVGLDAWIGLDYTDACRWLVARLHACMPISTTYMHDI